MDARTKIETSVSTLSLLIGVAIVVLALAHYMTNRPLIELLTWSTQTMGADFLALLLTLSALAIYSWLQVSSGNPDRSTYVMGVHAANGVATIALTYTLFGISKGIGGLSETTLSPETVAGIISDLTGGFQQAFITTVVGLPVSALLRAMLHVAESKQISSIARLPIEMR